MVGSPRPVEASLQLTARCGALLCRHDEVSPNERLRRGGLVLGPGAMAFGVVEFVMPRQMTSPFTQQERDLIRLELMPRFG